MKQYSKDTVGFINDYMLHTYTMLYDIVQFINVTGFAKPFLLAQQLKSNLWLNTKAILQSRHTKHMGIDSQVCFHR